MKKLRVFISSPGDVQIERNIARNVIKELNSLYAQHLKIEVLMWEDFPLSADATFQEGINYFLTNEHIDLAVFILWSRLGTPLSVKFRKEDGSPYKSGTEYEFDLMMKLHKECGHPSRILTYVKKDEAYPKDCKWDELRELLRQKEGLDTFLKEYFRDEETNSNYAYLPFGKKISFEQVFRTHLTNAIKDYIGEVGDLKEWEGNPYVGLKSFEYDQASIFFGRRHLVYETASRLISLDNNDSGIKSLIVLGESGSGKSSFVKAGLLPFLCNTKQSAYDYVIVNPSMYGGNMYNGLLEIIESNFGFLANHPFLQELHKGITSETNFNYLSYELQNKDAKSLIIYIDQFEELFSDNLITEEERKKVILLLRGLVSSEKIAIFMSMRSDFYNRFSLYEEMTQIKENSEVLDLPVMGASEIAEIIEEPARKACLRWEVDAKGVSLNRYVLKDAVAIKGLPLIEFALSELYETRNEKDVLTREAYDKIGGLKGAVINYADKCYASFTEEEKNALNDILSFVITESASNKETYVRKTSVRADMEKSPLHKAVIDKLLDARLFVTGKDSLGRPTITIIHEILLKSWSVIAEWIEKEKEFIWTNRHYEQLAQHWTNANKKKTELIQGRSSLLEAEYFHYKYHDRASIVLLDYLEQSFIKQRKTGLPWLVVAAVFMSLTTLIFILIKASKYVTGISFIDNSNILDILLVLGAILLLVYYSIGSALSYKPKYKTIKNKIVVWTIAAVMTGIYSIIGQPDIESILITLTFPFVPLVFYLLLQVKEATRRRKWTDKYVGYSISDEFWSKFKTISILLLIGFALISVGTNYTYAITEQKDQFASVADELFDGLNNLQAQLSYVDNKYVNERRIKYLEDHFSNDLNDDYGDIRDLQYARSLYNLNDPQAALSYLSATDRWDHHIFEIICHYAMCNYEASGDLLKEYVISQNIYEDSSGYHEIDNNISTGSLIWISEVLGDFECASQLDSIVMAEHPDSQYNPGYVLNRGHIYLYDQDLEMAAQTYKQAFESGISMGYVDKSGQSTLRGNLRNDLHIFSRFNVIPDSVLQEIANKMSVDFIPAYIPVSKVNSSETDSILSKLAGSWTYRHTDNTSLNLTIQPDSKMYTYIKKDVNGNEIGKSFIESRFANVDGKIYWDEFCPRIDYNSYGKIIEIHDDYFVVEVIENGVPAEKGTIRRYERTN